MKTTIPAVLLVLLSSTAGCSSSSTPVVRETKGDLVAETVATDSGYSTRVSDEKHPELGVLEWDTQANRAQFRSAAVGEPFDVGLPSVAPSPQAANRIALSTAEAIMKQDPTARDWWDRFVPFCCTYIGYGGTEWHGDDAPDYDCEFGRRCGGGGGGGRNHRNAN